MFRFIFNLFIIILDNDADARTQEYIPPLRINVYAIDQFIVAAPIC